MRRRRLTPLLLLSLFACVLPACQKDVKEVRNQDQMKRAQEARRKDVPVAPSGEPVGLSGAPVTP